MTDRNCVQCGKPVVVGHQLVSGASTDADGAMTMDVEHRHYDCLPVALRDADPFVTAARETAESGIRDEALQAHLEGVMSNGG